jgi:putative SOS response-associated peptidase YedK
MCGRMVQSSPREVLAEAFGVEEIEAEPLPERYNVAPAQPVYAVVGKGPRPVLTALRWGLVPWWAKDPSIGSRMINAKAEGIAAKPAFREAWRKRRCLVPADAFYEWKKEPAGAGRVRRTPFAIRLKDGRPMALAGLWERWGDLLTCTVITTSANELLAPIHGRMPVVLDPSDWKRWLDGEAGLELLSPAPPQRFEVFAVSERVNRVSNEGPELLEPVPKGVARSR